MGNTSARGHILYSSVVLGWDVNILQPSVICELLDFRGVGVVTYWNVVAENWGTTFHFDCVPPVLVEWKYYFANCVFCIATVLG